MGTLSLADAKADYASQQQQLNNGAAVRKADKDKNIFDFLSGDPKIEKAIAAVAAEFFTPDRFLRLAVNAVKKTPLLAYCDVQTVLGAFMTSAALGLEPNTVLQQAFLIPYKKRAKQGNEWVDVYECNFQIGARGFVTLAHRSPQIATLQSEAIRERDLFEHMLGTETFLKYQKTLKDRGDLIGSFCFTKLADGNEMATVLPLDEVHKIRSRSETFNALTRAVADANGAADKAKAQKKLDDTPWVMWLDDMASKSATKKHAKQLPLSPGDAMSVAAQLDSDDGRTIDMASMTDVDRVRAVMKEGVDAHETGGSSSSEAYGMRSAAPAPAAAPAVAALGDNPSPTVVSTPLRTEQAETVDVREASTAPHRAEQQQLAIDERSSYDKLLTRLSSLTDIEMLDTEADLISEVASDDREAAELHAAYTSRRTTLANPKPPVPIKARPRGGMSID